MDEKTPKVSPFEQSQSDNPEAFDAHMQSETVNPNPVVFVPKDKMYRPGDTVRLSENKGMIMHLGASGMYEHVGYIVQRDAENTDRNTN